MAESDKQAILDQIKQQGEIVRTLKTEKAEKDKVISTNQQYDNQNHHGIGFLETGSYELVHFYHVYLNDHMDDSILLRTVDQTRLWKSFHISPTNFLTFFVSGDLRKLTSTSLIQG